MQGFMLEAESSQFVLLAELLKLDFFCLNHHRRNGLHAHMACYFVFLKFDKGFNRGKRPKSL